MIRVLHNHQERPGGQCSCGTTDTLPYPLHLADEANKAGVAFTNPQWLARLIRQGAADFDAMGNNGNGIRRLADWVESGGP